jgi:small subunit ribosomal protein S15
MNSGDRFMALSTAAKAQIVKTHQRSQNDTGSSEVQIALLTVRINSLTEHLKIHKHDFHTRYGLTKMVSQRRKLMRYLKNKDAGRYQQIVKALDIRG